ncbi:MAG TPA: ABC transporter substrate-binding protein [Opitutaceae bacterium]|nr:ABC transporter substrate-binding protein [Opitutaceae bacterium]
MLAGTLTAGAGLAGLTVVGCGDDDDDDDNGSNPTNTPGDGPTTQPTSADSGNFDATLTSGIGSDAGSLDPQSLAGTGGGNWPNTSTHFVTPLHVDQDTSDVVGWAADWEWVDDNAALMLTARPGVTFHNGETLNAEQLKFNLDRELGRAEYNPAFESGHASQFASVGDVSIIDDMTIRVELAKPDVLLPTRIAGTMFLVEMNAVIEQGDSDFAQDPVGSGPFKYISRVPDSEIKSERFDDFFYGRDEQYAPRLPYVKNLVQRVIPEDTARLAALETGEIDLADKVSPDLAASFEDRSGFTVFYMPGDQPMHIHINIRDENAPGGGPNPWRDVRVRQAANIAVDLDTIIQTLLTGNEKRSYGSAQRSFGFPSDLESKKYEYDPQQAKALLAEAGYEDGFDTSFYYPVGRWPNTEPVVQAIAGYLGDVGINCSIQAQQYQVTTTAFKERSNDGLTFWGMAGGSDPGPNFRYGYHSGGGYTMAYDESAGLDLLIEESETIFDPEERRQVIGEVITKFYENAHWIFLYEPVTIAVGSDKLEWSFYNNVLSNPEYWNIKVKSS